MRGGGGGLQKSYTRTDPNFNIVIQMSLYFAYCARRGEGSEIFI